ncbi:LysR family transcriptional regulator [Xanthobacter dioxanivorans]|uniref:LysR family transcriptional regulator n=1 Tax=Xanthobacter dioxanivorans TaxID=2528964 RepID=A0A974PMR2_9HYPH|nr:LysR substrate-binding domain-containing protein [Xanthobacter dioxanivorans]QRG06419.1 LysR family transcriptional regulator [Xanthobacter dioxanivorans]
MGRRVARLEKEVGAALVARAGRRTVITEQGQKLAQAAEEIESIVLRKIVGLGEDEMQVAGRVRIGAPEGLGVGYLARRLAELSVINPKLETELVALPRTYSLASREVDIAITLDRPGPGQVSVKKLTDYTLGLYGTPAYFARRGRPAALAELKDHALAGYIPDLLFTNALNFSAADTGIEVSPVIRSTSVIAQVNAVLCGAAIGVLPGFLAAGHAELVPLMPEAFRLTRSYWVSVHDDLRRLNRIRAVLDAVTATVRADRAIFIRR